VDKKHQVKEIWQGILRVENLDENECFFQAGGNSLGAMKLAMRIGRQFSVDISLQDIVANSSIEKQVQLINSRDGQGSH